MCIDAIDDKERQKEVLNQMCLCMYLFWWYSEKSQATDLILGMAADYIKLKLHYRCFTILVLIDIKPVWLNGWVFVYELSDCGFESHCSH